MCIRDSYQGRWKNSRFWSCNWDYWIIGSHQDFKTYWNYALIKAKLFCLRLKQVPWRWIIGSSSELLYFAKGNNLMDQGNDQRSQNKVSFFKKFTRFWGAIFTLLSALFLSTLFSVSYTHLDVYKRQVLYWCFWRCICSYLRGCLAVLCYGRGS